MSTLTLKGNPSGAGTFIVESPNSANSRTITLPDATTTLVGTDATQTLTNKTISSSTIQGGALTLMTAQASTAGTTIDFTGIPSWVRRITVMFDRVSVSGTSTMGVVLGTTSGFEVTGYNGMAMATTTGGNAAITLSASFLLYDNTPNATMLNSGHMVITRLTGNTWVASASVGNDGASRFRIMGGSKVLGGEITQLRVLTTNGTDTFDNGTINVMYEG
jgi:hypothetical protein